MKPCGLLGGKKRQLKKGEGRCHFCMPIVFMNKVKITYKPVDNIKKVECHWQIIEIATDLQ